MNVIDDDNTMPGTRLSRQGSRGSLSGMKDQPVKSTLMSNYRNQTKVLTRLSKNSLSNKNLSFNHTQGYQQMEQINSHRAQGDSVFI